MAMRRLYYEIRTPTVEIGHTREHETRYPRSRVIVNESYTIRVRNQDRDKTRGAGGCGIQVVKRDGDAIQGSRINY